VYCHHSPSRSLRSHSCVARRAKAAARLEGLVDVALVFVLFILVFRRRGRLGRRVGLGGLGRCRAQVRSFIHSVVSFRFGANALGEREVGLRVGACVGLCVGYAVGLCAAFRQWRVSLLTLSQGRQGKRTRLVRGRLGDVRRGRALLRLARAGHSRDQHGAQQPHHEAPAQRMQSVLARGAIAETRARAHWQEGSTDAP